MALNKNAKTGIFTVMLVTFILVTGGLFTLVNNAVSEPLAQMPAAGAEAGVAACDFTAWVGKSADEAEAAAKATGRPYRMLAPNSMITEDYSADRINIEYDDKKIVTKVSCG